MIRTNYLTTLILSLLRVIVILSVVTNFSSELKIVMSIFTLFPVVVSISRGFLDYFSFPVHETAVVTPIVGSQKYVL